MQAAPRIRLPTSPERLLALLPAAAFLLLVAVTAARIALGYASQVSYGVYAVAVERWWAGQDPYPPGVHGFEYLPTTLVLFSPFVLLGKPLGGILWCLASSALYATGLLRLCRALAPEQAWQALGLSLIATWFSLKANLADGQAQVIMAGLLLHGAAALTAKRWRQAALALALAVAVKPVALPVAGLAFAVHAPLRAPLAVAVLAALLLPFLYPDPAFIVATYRAAATKLLVAGSIPRGVRPWLADVSTMLDRFGLQLSIGAQTALRAAAALGMLGIAIRARRSAPESLDRTILALGLLFLTLFNPRSESVSYVALTPAFGLGAAAMLIRDARSPLGWGLLAAGVALGVPWNRTIDSWLKPALALAYLLLIASSAIRGRGAPWFDRRATPGAAA